MPFPISRSSPQKSRRGVYGFASASVRNVPIQSVDAKIKTFNRLHSYLARLEALDAGADDAIMLDLEGYVTEGRGANVFIVRNGQLFTPPEGLLEGITRETVFELAFQEGLPATEERLTPYDLYNADEVFYCTTAGGIMPIVEVDRRQVGSGVPGAITDRLRAAYWKAHVSGPHVTPVTAYEAVTAT